MKLVAKETLYVGCYTCDTGENGVSWWKRVYLKLFWKSKKCIYSEIRAGSGIGDKWTTWQNNIRV